MLHRNLLVLSILLVPPLVFEVDRLHAADKAKPTVIVSDVLTTPGGPVQLGARVFEEGLLGRDIALGGETLEFLVQGKVVGSTMTGGDGRAFFEFAPRMRGNLPITARVAESPRVLSAVGTGLLASWERRRPILLIDLAAVVEERTDHQVPLPSLPINLAPTVLGEAEDQAAKELEKLGRFFYNLMYLYRSEGGDKEVIQEWIRTHEFPPGFPRIIPSGREALEELINQLREDGWENLTGGIGHTADFAEALVEHRLKAIIVHDPEDKEDFPRRAILVKSWNTVRKHL